MHPRIKFALFHHGALGDFVVLFPLLKALAPHPVALVASSARGRLAAGRFHHVRAYDSDRPHFVRLFGFDALEAGVDHAALRRDLGQPAWIISFVGRPHDPWGRQMAAVLPEARLACVDLRPPDAWSGHVTEWHRHQLEEAGLHLPPLPPQGRVAAPPPGPVLVHFGSGGRHKCWDVRRWITLIAALRARGYVVEVIYGEAEQERMTPTELARWRGEGACFVETLDALEARIARCGTFIGHDAGPTHLASQLGVRTIALFGPTSPRCWAPIGPNVQVLAPPRPAEMTWLSVDDVVRAVYCDDRV